MVEVMPEDSSVCNDTCISQTYKIKKLTCTNLRLLIIVTTSVK